MQSRAVTRKDSGEAPAEQRTWPPDPNTCREFLPDSVHTLDELDQDRMLENLEGYLVRQLEQVFYLM